MGTASARGGHWAASVARQVGTARDWPPFTGKARTIALRWVADLGGDQATRERRAEACWAGAALEWERMRANAAREYRPPAIEPTWPL